MRDPSTFDLRHKVTIEQPTETQGADGSVVQTWALWRTCYASVEPLSGAEYFSAQATQASVSGRVWVPWVDGNGVTSKMRVVWGDRTFEIESVINYKERNEWLQLMCNESV